MPVQAENKHDPLPNDLTLKSLGYLNRFDVLARTALFVANQFCHSIGHHASLTKSETSQSRSVTLAAIAGVMRMEE